MPEDLTGGATMGGGAKERVAPEPWKFWVKGVGLFTEASRVACSAAEGALEVNQQQT